MIVYSCIAIAIATYYSGAAFIVTFYIACWPNKRRFLYVKLPTFVLYGISSESTEPS